MCFSPGVSVEEGCKDDRDVISTRGVYSETVFLYDGRIYFFCAEKNETPFVARNELDGKIVVVTIKNVNNLKVNFKNFWVILYE